MNGTRLRRDLAALASGRKPTSAGLLFLGLYFDCRLRYPDGFTPELCFQAGDGVTALFGPSGGGKSTTLALIAGLRRPDAGVLRLGSRTLTDPSAGIFLPPEAGAHWESRVESQVLHLPCVTPDGAEVVHVRFLPSEVILARGPVAVSAPATISEAWSARS
jgi:energy-coupling factor transporter ATP-binding protein EcfA2